MAFCVNEHVRDPFEAAQEEHVGRQRTNVIGCLHGRDELREGYLAEFYRRAAIGCAGGKRLTSFLGQ